MNYFEFYDIPVSLRPDAGRVRKKYIENSRKYHPDFHTAASRDGQDEALRYSTLNTEAYRTLSDRDLLIAYVLRLESILEEGEKYVLPPAFLAEMMDVNEELMELEFDADPTKAQDLHAQMAKKQSALDEELERAIAVYEDAGGSKKPALPAVKDVWYRRKYLLRIQERLNTFASRK